MLSLQKHNTRDEFLKLAGEQIRWKRARTPLLYELEIHISDRRDALIEEGMEEAVAEAMAVSEMGDPEAIGAELDRVHRPKPNLLLLFGSAALLIAGIALLWAVGGATEQFGRMIVYVCIGVVFLFLGYFLDYTALSRYAVPVFAVLCSVCIVSAVMRNVFHSTAHQLCYSLPLAYISLVWAKRNSKFSMAFSVGGLLCVMLASSLSFAPAPIIFYNLVVCCAVLFFAAAKGWLGRNRFISMIPALACVALFLLFAVSLALRSPHFVEFRIMGALRPYKDPYGAGWVPLQVRSLIDSSVFAGAGESSENLDAFMQNADFSLIEYMLAAASHKFGLVIFAVVAVLVLVLAAAVIIGVKKQSSRFGKLVILTVGLSFLLRIAAYISCNLGFTLISLDGIPMFSCNGKLLIFDMFTMGLLLSVFRMESIARDSSASPNTLIHS